MCSIAGFALLEGANFYDKSRLIDLIKKMLVAGQVRGDDATGIALTRNSFIDVLKDNAPAKEFVDDEATVKFLEDNIDIARDSDDPTKIILCHTRKKTVGSQLYNVNNHPIVTKNVVGVHNGGVSLHTWLFKEYEMERYGEVDSEIIFRLISKFYKQSKNLVKAIEETTALIGTSFACGMVHKDAPNNLFLFRGSNPTIIRIYQKAGLVIFGSTENMLKACVVGHEGFLGKGRDIEYNIDEGIVINVKSKKLGRLKLETEHYGTYGYHGHACY